MASQPSPCSPILWPLRTVLRFIRDADGILTYLTTAWIKPNYTLEGQCKKRGLCCKNIAVGFSDKNWNSPGLKQLALWWYTFVYNFSCKGIDPTNKVMMFSCNYLKNNQCSIYWKRPYACRRYPKTRFFDRPTLLPGCGYVVTTNQRR